MRNLAEWWIAARKNLPKEAHRCFDSLVVLFSWLLWKERNSRTFDRRVQTIQNVLARVADEIVFWYQARFRQVELARCFRQASRSRNHYDVIFLCV